MMTLSMMVRLICHIMRIKEEAGQKLALKRKKTGISAVGDAHFFYAMVYNYNNNKTTRKP